MFWTWFFGQPREQAQIQIGLYTAVAFPILQANLLSAMRLRTLIFALLCLPLRLNAYTTVYNGVEYSSAKPHNLNVFYFKAADVPLDGNHRKRISAMMLWLQQYYGQQMAASGYGNKTFGLFTETLHPDSIRLVQIDGALNLNAYRNNGNDLLINEVDQFRNDNPDLVVSQHSLVLVATPAFEQMSGLPYYGLGRTCFATDYPQLNLQYLGQTGLWADRFVTYFGGIAHELGHGLNLPHSHQTKSENLNPAQGTSLMADGNYTLTRYPTFINRAGCAILDRCQVFSDDSSGVFYNGNTSGLLRLHTQVASGKLILSGRMVSNREIRDVNFYQDPFASPSAGYVRVAFSVQPLGPLKDSFYVEMPAAEVLQGAQVYPTTGPYNLEIELVLANGETASSGYNYQYSNGLPVVNFGFGDENCFPGPNSWQLADIGYTFRSGSICMDSTFQEYELRSWSEGYSSSTYDRLTILYRPMQGTDTLTCRVLSVSPVWNDLGGLMMRSSIDTSAAFAAVSSLDTRGVFWQWRSSNGASNAYQLVTELPMPMWLRLTRSNNLVKSFYSVDGQNWTLYYSRSINLGSNPIAGLVTVKNGARARFDNLSLSSMGTVTANPEIEVRKGPSIFPNPGKNYSWLEWYAGTEERVQISIRDAGGRELKSLVLLAAAGRNLLPLSAQELPEGIYSLSVSGEKTVVRLRWVVQK